MQGSLLKESPDTCKPSTCIPLPCMCWGYAYVSVSVYSFIYVTFMKNLPIAVLPFAKVTGPSGHPVGSDTSSWLPGQSSRGVPLHPPDVLLLAGSAGRNELSNVRRHTTCLR